MAKEENLRGKNDQILKLLTASQETTDEEPRRTSQETTNQEPRRTLRQRQTQRLNTADEQDTDDNEGKILVLWDTKKLTYAMDQVPDTQVLEVGFFKS